MTSIEVSFMLVGGVAVAMLLIWLRTRIHQLRVARKQIEQEYNDE